MVSLSFLQNSRSHVDIWFLLRSNDASFNTEFIGLARPAFALNVIGGRSDASILLATQSTIRKFFNRPSGLIQIER